MEVPQTLVKILVLVVPGLIALAGNIIFYWVIKGKVDKSIEKHKIAYSGVFKERIEIYRELLKCTFEIKSLIQKYQYVGDESLGGQIMEKFNILIQFYLINQPFLSDPLLGNFKRLSSELQGCFESFYLYNSVQGNVGIDAKTRTELLNNFFDASNKLKGDNPIVKLENCIIQEMKNDLHLHLL